MARRGVRDDGGATAVEFALVMLPLIYLVFGIIQYGLYFYAMQAGTSATSDAVRRITVGDCQDPAERKQFIHTRLSAASVSPAADIDVTPVYKTVSGGADSAPGTVGGSVTLTVTFNAINMSFPFIPVPDDGEVTREVFDRMEDTSPNVGGCQ